MLSPKLCCTESWLYRNTDKLSLLKILKVLDNLDVGNVSNHDFWRQHCMAQCINC